MICILRFEPFLFNSVVRFKLVGVPPFRLQPARPAWQVRCTDLVSRSFVQYVTELAALTADQQIKRDMQHMFGNLANTYS